MGLGTTLFSFFFDAAPPSPFSTLSLHDALPIFSIYIGWAAAPLPASGGPRSSLRAYNWPTRNPASIPKRRSEEHTSELQSHVNLVCRLLLEKKNNRIDYNLASLQALPVISTNQI